MKPNHAKHHEHALKRKKVTFFSSAVLIGIIFVVLIVAILTGQFRQPSADQTNRRRQSFPTQAKLEYTEGTTRKSVTSNTVNLIAAPYPAGLLPLQALDGKLGSIGETSGTVTFRGSSISADNLPWATSTNADSSRREITFDNPQLLQKIDDALTPPHESIEVILKPKYYLAVSTSTTDIDAMLSFPTAPAGDLVEDNTVDLGDFAALADCLDKPVTDANRFKDLNRDGACDLADFAVMAANLDETGAQ